MVRCTKIQNPKIIKIKFFKKLSLRHMKLQLAKVNTRPFSNLGLIAVYRIAYIFIKYYFLLWNKLVNYWRSDTNIVPGLGTNWKCLHRNKIFCKLFWTLFGTVLDKTPFNYLPQNIKSWITFNTHSNMFK